MEFEKAELIFQKFNEQMELAAKRFTEWPAVFELIGKTISDLTKSEQLEFRLSQVGNAVNFSFTRLRLHDLAPVFKGGELIFSGNPGGYIDVIYRKPTSEQVSFNEKTVFLARDSPEKFNREIIINLFEQFLNAYLADVTMGTMK